jgi:hypothetical protein
MASLRSRHPFLVLLILVSISVICVRPVWAEVAMNIDVTDPGANFQSVFTGGDFDTQRNVYSTMGEAAYKDGWVTFFKTIFGWTVSEPSMKVNIDPDNGVMMLTFHIQDVVKMDGYRHTINLKALKDAGWIFVQQEGNHFIFEMTEMSADLAQLSLNGPFLITVTAPQSAINLSIDDSNYQIGYFTAIPFPWESILIGLFAGMATLMIIRKRKYLKA